MMKFRPIVIGSIMLGAFASGMSLANPAVPVVDVSRDASAQTAVATSQGAVAQSSTPANQAAQMFFQLESLQQEVQELRGIVEQQAYQIKRMREEQRDRYLDLDRRITLLNKAPGKQTSASSAALSDAEPSVTSAAPVAAQPSAQSQTLTSTTGANSAGEKDAYQAAFRLVRDKQYAKASGAFEQLIKDYPDGKYTGNAYYWLGEVLLVESDHEQALKAFGALLSKYPGHRKVADAKYKQGKIYLQLGDNARAKQLLQEVVNQHAGSSAARLAEAEMRDAQL